MPSWVSWILKWATCRGSRAGRKGLRDCSCLRQMAVCGMFGTACIPVCRLRRECDGRGRSRGIPGQLQGWPLWRTPLHNSESSEIAPQFPRLSLALVKMADVLRKLTEVPALFWVHIITSNQHNSPGISTAHPFYRRENWGRERINTFPKVMEPGIVAESVGCVTAVCGLTSPVHDLSHSTVATRCNCHMGQVQWA